MTRYLTILFTLIFISNYSLAQEEKDSIDIRLEYCLSIDSNITTKGMISCTQISMDEWDGVISKYYSLLLDSLNKVAKEKLIVAQQGWTEYRKKEFEFLSELYANKDGTMWRVVLIGDLNEIVKNRAIMLREQYWALTFE